MSGRVVMETRRLVVREWRDEDLDPLAALLGDPETMRYYPRPHTRQEARDWIERNRARHRLNGFGMWAVEDRATGEFVGNCGPAVQIVEGLAEVEIGWHVIRSRWRQGIAAEAASAVRDYAFGPLGLRRLIALVRPENEPSAGVARKIGMAVEREAVFHDLPHLVFASAPT